MCTASRREPQEGAEPPTTPNCNLLEMLFPAYVVLARSVSSLSLHVSSVVWSHSLQILLLGVSVLPSSTAPSRHCARSVPPCPTLGMSLWRFADAFLAFPAPPFMPLHGLYLIPGHRCSTFTGRKKSTSFLFSALLLILWLISPSHMHSAAWQGSYVQCLGVQGLISPSITTRWNFPGC